MLALVLPKRPPGGCQGTDRGRALSEVTQLQSLVLGDSQMGGRTGHFSKQVPSCHPLTETSGTRARVALGRELAEADPRARLEGMSGAC